MLKELIVILLFFLFGSAAFGQNRADRLIKSLDTARASLKPVIYREIAFEYYGKDSDKFLDYSFKSAHTAEINGDKYNQAYALRLVGIAYDMTGNYKEAQKYVEQAYQINKAINAVDGIEACISSLGIIYYNQSKFDKALEMYLDALRLFEKSKLVDSRAITLSHLGGLYVKIGDLPKAAGYYKESYALKDQIKDEKTKAVIINNYIRALQYENAPVEEQIRVLQESLDIKESLGDINGLAVGYQQMSQHLSNAGGSRDDINKYLYKALEYAKKVNDRHLLGEIYYDLGKDYLEFDNDTVMAIKYLDSSYAKGSEIYHLDLLSKSSYLLGRLHFGLENYKHSAAYTSYYALYKDTLYKANYAEEVSKMSAKFEADKKEKEIALLNKQNELNKMEILKSQEQALRQSQEIKLLALAKKNEEALKEKAELEKSKAEMASAQAKMENEKKAQEIDLLSKDKALKAAEALAEKSKRQQAEDKNKLSEEKNKRQGQLLTAAVIGLILILGLVFFVLNGYRQKKKANALLAGQNAAILAQKNEIEDQKVIIEEKNQDIVDSITYAKRLQTAILPTDEFIQTCLPDSFVFFQPKDIVSGDFYWMFKSREKTFFAAVDCTGHGVPGAMVSMVGHNGLNRAVKEFDCNSPAAILDKLNESVIETFEQKGGTEVRDGMDIALCSIEKQNGALHLEYAGANNPVWIVSQQEILSTDSTQLEPNKSMNDVNLFEIKADKQPIGPYDNIKKFSNHSIQLKEGDRVFLFSDGYADQFGSDPANPHKKGGKKFKYANLKRLLMETHQLQITDQKDKLIHVFNQWKSDFEQLDDVCVIGVRV